MSLQRMARLTALVGLLCLAAPPVIAQLSQGFATPDFEEDEPRRFSMEETKEVLLLNGIPEEVVDAELAKFPEDQLFLETEIQLIYQLLKTEEPLTPTDDRAVRAKRLGLKPEELPLFIEEELPEEYEETLLKPFGYEIFRYAKLPGDPPEDIAVGPDYVVGVGDQILITTWGDIQQRHARTIDRQGRLVLPDVGVVTLAGKTLAEAREELEALFGQVYRNIRMTVSVGDVRTIQVYVSGDVHRPGNYTLNSLSTIFTALYYAGGPTYKGSLRRITLSRRGGALQEFDLYGFLIEGDRNMDIPLQSGDVVHVRPLGPTVRIEGEVRRPAIYEIRTGETLRDAIPMAGGLTPLALDDRIAIDRNAEISGTQLYKINWQETDQDLTLQGGDEIHIFSIHHVRPKEFVEIHGFVQRPGLYRLVPGMRVSDIVFRAGGLAEGAYLERGELARLVSGFSDEAIQTELINLPLREIFADPATPANCMLKRGDKVFVRGAPGWEPPPVVTVEGEVCFPGKYGLRGKNERISDLLERSGGTTEEAFPMGARLFRAKEGRVIVDFSKVIQDPRNSENIELADGDSIFVPKRPETVKVHGQVATPGLLLYEPGKKARDYIRKTGGLTEKADEGRIRIIRVTGEAQSAMRRFWWDPSIKAGDEIYVELKEDQEPIDWSKTLKDATVIVSSLATAAYVITQMK